MKKVLFILPLVALAAFLFWNNAQKNKLPNYEYYWAMGCSHCQTVDEFFGSWEGKNNINLVKREVSSNQNNVRLYNARASSCNIPEEERGVPLLFTPDEQCLLGDQPIIDHFKNSGI